MYYGRERILEGPLLFTSQNKPKVHIQTPGQLLYSGAFTYLQYIGGYVDS